MTELELADDLGTLLTLERVDRDLFRGRNAQLRPAPDALRRAGGGAVPDGGGGDRGARPAPALVPRLLPARRPERPAGHPRGGPRPRRAVLLGAPRRGRAGRRGHLLHGHVVPRRRREPATATTTTGSSTTRRGAPVPEPEATPRAGWNPLLEVRQVTPTDFLKGVFSDCLVGALGDGAGRRPAGAPGRAHLPLRHRARASASRTARSSGAAGPRSTTPVVPGGHPSRRVGPGRPAAGQGPQRAGLLPGLAARPRRRAGRHALPGAAPPARIVQRRIVGQRSLPERAHGPEELQRAPGRSRRAQLAQAGRACPAGSGRDCIQAASASHAYAWRRRRVASSGGGSRTTE